MKIYVKQHRVQFRCGSTKLEACPVFYRSKSDSIIGTSTKFYRIDDICIRMMYGDRQIASTARRRRIFWFMNTYTVQNIDS